MKLYSTALDEYKQYKTYCKVSLITFDHTFMMNGDSWIWVADKHLAMKPNNRSPTRDQSRCYAFWQEAPLLNPNADHNLKSRNYTFYQNGLFTEVLMFLQKLM